MRNKKYYEFIKQFKKLKDQEKLNLIVFIVINYSEDFFISQKTSIDILKNPTIAMITKNTTDILLLDEKMLKEAKQFKRCELMNYKLIPNILSKKYALKNSKI